MLRSFDAKIDSFLYRASVARDWAQSFESMHSAKEYLLPKEVVTFTQIENWYSRIGKIISSDEFVRSSSFAAAVADENAALRQMLSTKRDELLKASPHLDVDEFVISSVLEASKVSFQKWVGSSAATLSIVFTDIVGSTKLCEELGDVEWNAIRNDHFKQNRLFIDRCGGREVKTIGDSFMAVFKSVYAALDYARLISREPGDNHLLLRAGLHLGDMLIEESDVFGSAVNFAARVVGAIPGPEIWLSERAKEAIEEGGFRGQEQVGFQLHKGVTMKGFPGLFTLWSIKP